MKTFSILLIFLGVLITTSCSDSFLNQEPQGYVTEDVLATKAGVAQLLVGAYHDVTGLTINSGWWSTSGTNWVYGDITSGDAYRGGYNDANDGIYIEEFIATPSTGYFQERWNSLYDGVSRSNGVIRAASKAADMTEDEKTIAIAEARFLRGHFHFEAKKMWNNIPYIDENVTDFRVSNEPDIWPQIIADFQFAFDHLPEVMDLKGKANKWAAACYLAKCHMFKKDFAAAQSMLNSIIPSTYGGAGSGVTSQGDPYGLMENFDDNFNAALENSPEHVFQIQFSVNDNSNGGNENIGESGNTPSFYPLSSFYTTWKQPSHNLVNSYRTDDDGLPLLDTYNDVNIVNDQDVDGYDYTYATEQGNLDPRLDWTVGRRGVPYLDWASPSYSGENATGYSSNPGSDPAIGWINDRTFGGPYTPIKNSYRASQVGVYGDYYAQGYLMGSGVNYSIIRFADVLLWAAECEIEVGSLDKARAYVNFVRARAMNGRMVEIASDYEGNYENSANYLIGLYNDAWADQVEARKAVRMERRLELALEGHRFFDLVRWGIAAESINAYLDVESSRIGHLSGVHFIQGKHEYFPIPQQEIDLSKGGSGQALLRQNPGY